MRTVAGCDLGFGLASRCVNLVLTLIIVHICSLIHCSLFKCVILYLRKWKIFEIAVVIIEFTL